MKRNGALEADVAVQVGLAARSRRLDSYRRSSVTNGPEQLQVQVHPASRRIPIASIISSSRFTGVIRPTVSTVRS